MPRPIADVVVVVEAERVRKSSVGVARAGWCLRREVVGVKEPAAARGWRWLGVLS
ncbi:hypothetical protein [Nonomuraea sp. NPDC049625]|uniref:hypothetical protein n=1 Tax=Nonomuraea sp. NPDC049625 TaxID=3155775 RepID=UPI003429EF55